jgi:branched-chain amino acid transport system permease protein
MGEKIRLLGKTNKHSLRGLINYGIIVVFFAVITLLKSAGLLTNALEGQLIPICAYIIMALSLNLVVGISGELSLGHAGFMSVGAFSGIIVAGAMKYSGVNANAPRLIVAVIVGAIMAGIAGILIGIPVLRLRGDYLAIVTLAFGEIIKNILNCLYVGVDAKGLHFSVTDEAHMDMAANGTTLVRGPMGAVGVSKASTFIAGIILIILVLFVIQNMVNSRTGRAIMAIRDNRIAAEASGINVTKYKMIAFVSSAVMAGAAGVLYGLNYSTVAPKKFDFNTSILVLVFVVLGGIGNMTGSIIAAAVLTVLPELLRQFQDYRMLVYAIVLILVMIATNNEKIRALWKRVAKSFTRKKGGEVNE